MKPRVREAILVEGRYDKNTLSQVVDATIFETSGFGIFRDREKIQFLRQVAEKRGLIIFTDSDGAGFVIRNRLKSMLPPDRLLQAYIPDIPGKERRKDKASKAGLLGVEGMTPEIILNSLRRCGAHFLEETAPAAGTLTRQDLYTLGLMGGPDSTKRRDFLKKRLNLPQQLATGGFLDALNLLTDREELENLLKEYESCTAK
jgi:ribonuclease M5